MSLHSRVSDYRRKYIIAVSKKDAKQFAERLGWLKIQWRYINRSQFLIGKTPAEVEVYVTKKGENSSTFDLRKECARRGFMGDIKEHEINQGELV